MRGVPASLTAAALILMSVPGAAPYAAPPAALSQASSAAAPAPAGRPVHRYLAVRISPDAAYVASVEGDSPKGGFFPDVRELVIDRLAKGPLRIDDIARELGMSSKTLERRLGERGVTFSALLDEVRCELAKRYLGETDFRLEQVAYLIGYSEPAPLVRAFKRWTGTTPMKYRGKRR